MKSNTIIEYFPYVIVSLCAFALPLYNIGLAQIHLFFLLFCILCLLPNFKNSFNKKGKIFTWLYITIILFFSLSSIVLKLVPFDVVIGAIMAYIAAPLFWILFYSSSRIRFNIVVFKKFAIGIAFATSLLAFIQFFGNKTIYGLLPEKAYFDIDFSQSQFVSSGSHFRVSSIFPSSQIFGLFAALMFCLTTSVYGKRILPAIILGVPILIASFLSGQRIALLIYVIFYGVKFLKLKKALIKAPFVLLLFGLILLALSGIVNHLSSNMGMANNRIFDAFNDIESVAKYEQTSRWTLWEDLILTTNPIVGEGIGYTNIRDLDNDRIVTSESYLIQLFYESGLLTLMVFVFMVFKSIRIYRRQDASGDDWIILIALFFSLVSVHSFLNPIFFVFWGIILYPLCKALNNIENYNIK